MARILPASVFKANFTQKDLKPTLGARGRAAWLSPSGIKTAVEITDAVGGTISDAVSRYARKQSEIARLRREDKKLKEEGFLGKLYASAEDEKLLEGKTYAAGQQEVVAAKTREARAAGYEKMRQAFDKPGSGRLLADPRRDPSRLLAEDYARLAAASPLPKDADLKPGTGKTGTPIKIGADAAKRAQDSVALTDGVNRALVLRKNLQGIEYDPLAENDPELVNTVIKASDGMFVLHMRREGDKTIPTVRLSDEYAKEAYAALDPTDVEGRKQIQARLHQQALAALKLRNNPNLNHATLKLQRFNELSTRYRQAGESGTLDQFSPNDLKELNALQAEISGAGGNVPFYLIGTGQQAKFAEERRLKAENEFVGKAREQLEVIRKTEESRELNKEEMNLKGLLESNLRKLGIDPATGGPTPEATLMSTPQDSGSTTTATVETNQEGMWQSAGGAAAPADKPTTTPATPPAMTPGAPADPPSWKESPMFRPDPKAPKEPPTYVRGRHSYTTSQDYWGTPENDPYLKVAENMRKAGISEDDINVALPGYGHEMSPGRPSMVDRWRGKKAKPKPIIHSKKGVLGVPGTGSGYGSPYQRWRSRTDPVRAKTRARMEAARAKVDEGIKEREKAQAAAALKAKATGAPKPVSTQNIRQKIGGKTVTHKFPTYKPMAVNAKNEKRRLPAVSAKDKARRVNLLRAAAKKYKIDPDLYVALADQESKYHDKAVSDQYAIGLTQMTPSAWLDIGGKPKDFKTLFNESVAAESGAKFLHLLRKRLIAAKELKKNDPKENEKIMAVYNAGLSAFRNEGFEIKSKKRKDGTFFSGLMNPKRSVPLRDKKGNKIFQKDAKGNKIPLKGKDGKQLKDSKGRLRWKIKTRDGETYNYVTKIMKNYKKIKALAAKGKAKKVKGVADKPGPKAPKEGS